MRQSPQNYIYAFAIFLAFWLIFGLGMGMFFANAITLATATNDSWMNFYMVVTGIVGLLGYVLAVYWFSEGDKKEINRPEVLRQMASKYNLLFALSFVFGLLGVIVLFVFYMSEGIELLYYLLFLIVHFALSAFGFWIVTFLFTPKGAEYCVLGKR